MTDEQQTTSTDLDQGEVSPDTQTDTGATPGPDATDGTGTDSGTLQLDPGATFTREYVESLRSENAGHRTRIREVEQTADTLARTLWVERVAALNILADPSDLEYDADLLHDRDGIETAARQLVEAKPHLRSRAITGRIGQGEGTSDTPISLLGLLRRGA